MTAPPASLGAAVSIPLAPPAKAQAQAAAHIGGIAGPIAQAFAPIPTYALALPPAALGAQAPTAAPIRAGLQDLAQ